MSLYCTYNMYRQFFGFVPWWYFIDCIFFRKYHLELFFHLEKSHLYQVEVVNLLDNFGTYIATVCILYVQYVRPEDFCDLSAVVILYFIVYFFRKIFLGGVLLVLTFLSLFNEISPL